jgi:HEPN domain-containing protein
LYASLIKCFVSSKSFKSLIVNSKSPPFIHDLVRLAEKGNLALDDEQKDILDTISTFNIRGRYDDYKREFHKKCTNTFTKTWIDHIKRLRKWIKIKFQI